MPVTGKIPTIIQAMSFAPADVQNGLKHVAIVGNNDYTINPRKDDFLKRMIDARNEVKAKMKRASGHEAARLDAEQQSIKIIANATSYGIFVEQIVEELDSPEHRMCFGSGGEPFQVSTAKGEKPGRYFHPLIATLITGAARLMLAITEVLASVGGLDWAFCDTDSMALAKPADMDNAEFMTLASDICDWFKPLNLYAKKGAPFKIEDANYEVADGKLTDKLEPLFCFAVSAKQYVLFNKTPDGNIKIRKASAHGLGHLLPPYAEADAPAEIPPPCVSLSTIGVDRWQYDLWYKIICAALDGHPDQVDLEYHPALDQPAASRYAATTPKQLRWFKTFNKSRPPSDQVRPFNFLLAFQASATTGSSTKFVDETSRGKRKNFRRPKPIAPYNKDICVAAWSCFDRETGEPVSPERLKTYKQALAQYHISPESKFLHGEPYDTGPTQRQHVEIISVNFIGKEANRWEEQYHLGLDLDAQIEYGPAPGGTTRLRELIGAGAGQLSERELASRTGISRTTLSKLIRGKPVRRRGPTLVGKVLEAVRMWVVDRG
jgi:hypothetical protein